MTERTAAEGFRHDVPVAGAGPWHWVSQAVGIYARQRSLSMGYGLLFVAIGYAIAFALRGAGLIAAMPVALGAFALAGPLIAAGLYAIARADETGRRAKPLEALLPKAASPLGIAYVGVIILVGVLFWALIAIGLAVIFSSGEVFGWRAFASFALSTPRGIAMLGLGTVLGGVIAAAIFAVSAFSIPMLMDRDVDFATAMGTSIQTVMSRPAEMALWAWIIVMSVAIGAATLLLGFVFLFPVLGYATWRGYREVLSPPG